MCPYCALFVERALYVIQFLMSHNRQSIANNSQLQQSPNEVATVHKSRKNKKNIAQTFSNSEQSYEPQFCQYKKIGLTVDAKRVTTGGWSVDQNRIYLKFLENFQEDFQNEAARRRTTVFNRLSKALRKRTPDQCRTHHQKLQTRFKNDLDKVIEFVREKIEKGGKEGPQRGKKDYECLKATATCTKEVIQCEDCIVISFQDLQGW